MAAVIIRNLDEDIHVALKRRAASKGRSTEAEIRIILREAVYPENRVRLGDELAALGKRLGGLDMTFERSSEPIEAAQFE
jgi:plasmid stability protein